MEIIKFCELIIIFLLFLLKIIITLILVILSFLYDMLYHNLELSLYKNAIFILQNGFSFMLFITLFLILGLLKLIIFNIAIRIVIFNFISRLIINISAVGKILSISITKMLKIFKIIGNLFKYFIILFLIFTFVGFFLFFLLKYYPTVYNIIDLKLLLLNTFILYIIFLLSVNFKTYLKKLFISFCLSFIFILVNGFKFITSWFGLFNFMIFATPLFTKLSVGFLMVFGFITYIIKTIIPKNNQEIENIILDLKTQIVIKENAIDQLKLDIKFLEKNLTIKNSDLELKSSQITQLINDNLLLKNKIVILEVSQNKLVSSLLFAFNKVKEASLNLIEGGKTIINNIKESTSNIYHDFLKLKEDLAAEKAKLLLLEAQNQNLKVINQNLNQNLNLKDDLITNLEVPQSLSKEDFVIFGQNLVKNLDIPNTVSVNIKYITILNRIIQVNGLDFDLVSLDIFNDRDQKTKLVQNFNNYLSNFEKSGNDSSIELKIESSQFPVVGNVSDSPTELKIESTNSPIWNQRVFVGLKDEDFAFNPEGSYIFSLGNREKTEELESFIMSNKTIDTEIRVSPIQDEISMTQILDKNIDNNPQVNDNLTEGNNLLITEKEEEPIVEQAEEEEALSDSMRESVIFTPRLNLTFKVDQNTTIEEEKEPIVEQAEENNLLKAEEQEDVKN